MAGGDTPVSGVIVRFRYRSLSPDTVTLRLADVTGNQGSGSGTGPATTLNGTGNVEMVPTRLPVQAGDLLGFDTTSTTAYSCDNGPSGSQVFEPRLVDFALPQTATGSECELLLSADVELDSDGDEFGDESQDNCPDTFNPDQLDGDGDGMGDACDTTPTYQDPYFWYPPGEGPPLGVDPSVNCAAMPFTGDERNHQAPDPATPNPLVGERWFVDPEEPSHKDWRHYKQRGKKQRAALMWRIAREPKFRWFGKFTRPNVFNKVREFLARVQCAQKDTVPLIAVLRGQSKECHGSYAGGGPTEDRSHRRWLEDFARAIGNSRVVIAYEPDSLGTIDCLKPSRRQARLKVLRYGVDLLSALPNATVYLEAGASDWEGADTMARKLRYIGIGKVRGFMLNATHSDWTRANIRFGTQVSRLTGGKHFLVNTAINGRGPTHVFKRVGGVRRRINLWCNAPRAGLGPRPTTKTGNRLVDGFLWIGRPGYSGGSCGGGPLPIGTWWREHALRLARRATQRKGP